MSVEVAAIRTLLLGIGNILLSDDGVGVHVIRALDSLRATGEIEPAVALRDGGTIGLELLSEFEDFGALIVIDAMEFGGAPGTVRVVPGDGHGRAASAARSAPRTRWRSPI